MNGLSTAVDLSESPGETNVGESGVSGGGGAPGVKAANSRKAGRRMLLRI